MKIKSGLVGAYPALLGKQIIENNTLVKERDRLVRETKRLEESINRERKLLGKVMKVLLGKELVVATRTDTKGQTTLHMAVKGQSLEVVEELIKADPSIINMVDNKGNTTLPSIQLIILNLFSPTLITITGTNI